MMTNLFTEILRRSAELTIHNVVRKLFRRLQELDPATEESKLQQVKMTVSTEAPVPTDGASDAQSETPTDAASASASAAATPDLRSNIQNYAPECMAIYKDVICGLRN
jgi:hypothetical protein